MENFETRKLDAADYHKAHPYMKSLDKALTHYFVTKTEDPAEHGEDFEAIKIDILNSLFHPQAKYDKRVESPNKKQNGMIITTATIIIVQALVVSWIVFTNPEPCPRKYRVTQEKGGVLVNSSDVHRYCELDYGGKFVLKNEYKE